MEYGLNEKEEKNEIKEIFLKMGYSLIILFLKNASFDRGVIVEDTGVHLSLVSFLGWRLLLCHLDLQCILIVIF